MFVCVYIYYIMRSINVHGMNITNNISFLNGYAAVSLDNSNKDNRNNIITITELYSISIVQLIIKEF